jgi:DNA-binding winged helix-turn-helix (wHTH) protein/TolB-like protein
LSPEPNEPFRIRFGPFEYDSAQKQLFRGGEPVDLQPKTLETLHVLAMNRGRVVDKAELIRQVWPDTVVEEIGLARNISQLRKALGEDAGSETYIQTVPRRGYRLAAAGPEPVQTNVPAVQTNSRWRTPAVAAIVVMVAILLIYWQFYRPSRWLPDGSARADLVVMPFSGEPAGFSEALAAELSAYPSIRVISPATVRRYRYIHVPDHWTARALGVELMVEGEWPSPGSSLGGTARLTDVHSGRMVWSQRLEDGDTKAAVRSIAAAIAARLSQAGR